MVGILPQHMPSISVLNDVSPLAAEHAGILGRGTRPGFGSSNGQTDLELWCQAKAPSADRDQRINSESKSFAIEPHGADRGQRSVAAALETWLQRSPPVSPVPRGNAEHFRNQDRMPLEPQIVPAQLRALSSAPLYHDRPSNMPCVFSPQVTWQSWGRMSDLGAPVDHMAAIPAPSAVLDEEEIFPSESAPQADKFSANTSASRLLAGGGGIGSGYLTGRGAREHRGSAPVPSPRGFRSPGSPLSPSLKSQFV